MNVKMVKVAVSTSVETLMADTAASALKVNGYTLTAVHAFVSTDDS